MGWASASDLYDSVIEAAQKYIPDPLSRLQFHIKMIDAFENYDWDTQEECKGKDIAFDVALKTLHPDWEEFE